MYNRTCEHCNEPFQAKMPHARFCPDKPCKQNFHKSKHKSEIDQVLNDLFSNMMQMFLNSGMSKGKMYELIDKEDK